MSSPSLVAVSKRTHLLLAFLVGILAGLIAVLYQFSVKKTEDIALAFGAWGAHHWVGWLLVPAFGGTMGLLVAKATAKVAPEASGGGIVNIKGTLLGVRKIRPLRVLPMKFLGSLGIFLAGFALGPEAPAIQMGGAMGQLVGDLFKLDKKAIRPLIAAGAGAGFAAVFNAPLAGFIFVIEGLRKEMSTLTYGTALIASVASVFVLRSILGQESVFHFSGLNGLPLHTLPVALLIGLCAGLVGYSLKKLILFELNLRSRFNIGKSTVGVVAGVVSGVILMSVPILAGSGQIAMAEILGGQFNTRLILGVTLLLCLSRMFLTALCHSSEVPGGVLVSTLTMGCYVGLFFSRAIGTWDPEYIRLMPGLVAIGMASALAASIRAPLTCTVLVVEITGEYGLLYALLVGTFAAYALGELFRDIPIDDALLDRDLKDERDIPHGEKSLTILELLVEPGSKMDQALVRNLDLPAGSLIMKIERGGMVIIPNGGTKIKEGDLLQVGVEASRPFDARRIEELTRS